MTIQVTVKDVRDLRGGVEREQAEIGVLLTLREPTQPMQAEAADAGFYESPGWGKSYPRLQILAVEELLAGKGIDYPPSGQVNVTFKKAPKAKKRDGTQLPLDESAASDESQTARQGVPLLEVNR